MSQPEADTLRPFQRGDYDFAECFYADTRGYMEDSANEEKHQIALVMGRLAKAFKDRNFIFGQGRAVDWLEPGCGDGFSTVKYIRAMAPHHGGRILVHASDIMPVSLTRATGHFAAARDMGVEVGALDVRDAFADAALTDQACDFALASHMVYHAQKVFDGVKLPRAAVAVRVDTFLGNVMAGLKEDGVLVALHESRASHLSGTLGATYGFGLPDAAEHLEESAKRLGLFGVAMPLHPKLYFPDVPATDLEAFEDVGNWKNYAPLSDQASWLKKFLFATQLRPHDGVAGGARALPPEQLAAAVRHTRRLLDANDGALVLHARLLAIPKEPARLSLVHDALLDVHADLPAIQGQVDNLRAAAPKIGG